ncbi:hypothetical protein L6164_007713 [Bauhinia variegata]|uniref:Uncharacterized protein n=1 Tax=Bauhinia variegata TaxID=167791 RepID=A0ACB9PFV3_BAUVA|nr:hypothetical protein L6164_007713 [Bauhinia variegata]
MSNLILSNSSLTRGDKTTIKGLKYNRSNQDILVDVDSWINPQASVPIYPLTELSRLKILVKQMQIQLIIGELKFFAIRATYEAKY